MRNVHFGIAARGGGIHRLGNTADMLAQFRPLLLTEYDNRQFAPFQVLLIHHVLVGRHEYVESCLLCCRKQSPVAQLLPASLQRERDSMPCEMFGEPSGRAMVEQCEHLPLLR